MELQKLIETSQRHSQIAREAFDQGLHNNAFEILKQLQCMLAQYVTDAANEPPEASGD